MKTGFPKVLKSGEKFCYKTVDSAVYNDEGYPLSDRLVEYELHKLKVGIIGDGITASKTDSTGKLIGFSDLLKEKVQSMSNYSISNLCLSRTTIDATVKPILDRYLLMDDNLDVILIAATSNDWNKNIPLGTATTDDTNEYTYRGALNVLIKGLYDKYHKNGKTPEIIFISPLHRHDNRPEITVNKSSYEKNSIDLLLTDYTKVLAEVCGRYSIPIIDITSTLGIDFSNEYHRTLFTDNGVHPNAAGHYKVYRRVYTGILSLI